MRNFRTAAVALATATTVAFGGVSAATAAETENTGALSAAAKGASSEGEGSLSSKAGDATGKDTPANGRDLLGSSVDDDKNPQWAQLWRDTTYVGVAAAAVSVAVATYNFAVYNGVIPDYVAQAMNGQLKF
ncbi:hypothetical protein HMPREF3227_02151 [Corynebacterium sp. CMW7794]|uniref:hypothetical protein n=1 Tax=Corynebacterium TaxID=1716 RepID=UPI000797F406|nr:MULTISPECIES: hypothetical protein [Corynebacterium]KXI15996.1 hypothetical protein HMPREF3227_02151 [Corynebacterium sp. CMW7794]